jgi:hypothetical protein
MESRNDPHEVIEALAGHEDAVGDLYGVFAMKFKREQDLWATLSDQEESHAALLRSLGAKADDLAIFVDADRFDPRQLNHESRQVKERVQVAEYSHMSLREALEDAIQLEEDMAESHSFRVFTTDTPSVQKVLTRLREDSVAHRERLRRRLSAL